MLKWMTARFLPQGNSMRLVGHAPAERVTMHKSVIFLIFLLLLAAGTFAGAPPVGGVKEADIVTITGTVRFIELEGGFFGIVSDTGKHYLPLNLGRDFRAHGLRVRIEGRLRKDIVTTSMWGTPLEIHGIEKLNVR
jgi:hypothetical protein